MKLTWTTKLPDGLVFIILVMFSIVVVSFAFALIAGLAGYRH